MNNSVIGVNGEALVLSYFIKEGYEVYLPFGGKTKHDLVVVKDGIVKTVQVKTTTVKVKSGGYIVQLRKVRSNKTTNKIYKFDKTSSDLLAIAIIPESKVVVMKCKDVNATSALTIK